MQSLDRKKKYPFWRYHEVEAPEGLLIKSEEMEKKLGEGWVNTPALFGNKSGKSEDKNQKKALKEK